MDKQLLKYKKNCDTKQTHLSFTNGKYNVPENEFTNFYNMYFSYYKNNEKMYLIEKITNSTYKFFYDIDSKDDDDLTNDNIKQIIDKTIDVINHYFKSNNGLDLSEFHVSKRTNAQKYHINFPNLVVDCDISKTIVKLVLDELPEMASFIDTSVYRTGLRIIGSMKKVQDDIYKPYDITTSTFSTIGVLSDFMKYVLHTTDDITEHTLKIKKQEQKVKIKGVENDIITQELDKLMSDYISNQTEYDSKNLQKTRCISTQNKMGLFCYYISISEDICPFKCRKHNRDTSPLYIEINSNGIYLKCYDSECIRRVYPDGGIALPQNFQQEYPEMYKSMHNKYWSTNLNVTPENKQYLEDSLAGTHFLVAQAAYNIYKDFFRVDDIKNSSWFWFDGNRWLPSYKLNIVLSTELPKYYESIKISDTTHLNNDMLDEFLVNKSKIDNNYRNSKVDAIIKNLQNVAFKNSVIDQITYLFKEHDINFYKMLDTKTNLIGFSNGVYDIETETFRSGSQNDYLTFNTGYDYIDYSPDDKNVKEIFEFLGKIITNNQVLEFLLKILAKSLTGKSDEKFYIWTGIDGANGKSTLVNFLEMTLGEYTTSVDVSLLTNKRGLSSNASPDVIRLRGKRLLTFQEPEGDDKLRTGILKQFSGNDTVIARELFKSPITFKLQGTMIMCCNQLPNVSSIDGGTWRRIRVIEFNSKFCENPTRPNEFKIDTRLKHKMKQWKPYFMGILLHYLKDVKANGIDEPEQVKAASNNYKLENDKFNEFFDDCIEENKDQFITIKELYQTVVHWWSLNSTTKTPDLKEFKMGLKMRYGNETKKDRQLGYHLSIIEHEF